LTGARLAGAIQMDHTLTSSSETADPGRCMARLLANDDAFTK